ncbi:hypothetical protein [Aneurinibacillus aneurinilyticus]|uniref:hypothetical protein n=1 Tax=Aneurinibacillus aneurinilyticus TaxID=1391 RepID=UPI0023F08DCB|nr:hypothetical protein [Aneurinibacillus aneurinilyticus]
MTNHEDMMLILGQSKMDKMQEQFVQTDKETGYMVARKVGSQGFLLWWYLWGMCYGRSKIHAYPKKETIVKDLIGECDSNDSKEQEKWMKSKKATVQRWMRLLEDEKMMKRVPAYNPNGTQRSNLYILNASYPEIPDGWDAIFEHGVVIENATIIARKNEQIIAQDTNIYTPENEGIEISTPHENRMQKNLHPEKSGYRNIYTHENEGIEISTPQSDAVQKNLQVGYRNIYTPPNAEIPWGSKQDSAYIEGGIRKVEEQEINDDEDDDLYKSNQLNFFQNEFIEEAKERQLPDEEIKEIAIRLRDTQYYFEALDSTFDKVMPRYARGEISSLPDYFIRVLKREQRRVEYAKAQKKKDNSAKTNEQIEFPFYNWLEEERE